MLINAIMIISILLHVGVGLLWLVWLYARPTSSRVHLLMHGLAILGWTLTLHLGGAGWHLLTPARWLVWPLLVVLSVLVWRAHRDVPWRVERRAGPLTRLVILTLFSMMNLQGMWSIMMAQRLPDGVEPIAMAWPLPEGHSWVVHGGNDIAVNHHQAVPAQEQALDVLQISGWSRAQGLMPKELDAYAIFDQPLVSPCAGRVAHVENEHIDLTPPHMDPEHLAGNHVILHCQGYTVVLAHIKQGSVVVHMDQHVKVGQPLGRVGNTGNTSEPHLHIHAIQGEHTQPEVVFGRGEAVPMTFDGRYMTRLSQVKGAMH